MGYGHADMYITTSADPDHNVYGLLDMVQSGLTVLNRRRRREMAAADLFSTVQTVKLERACAEPCLTSEPTQHIRRPRDNQPLRGIILFPARPK